MLRTDKKDTDISVDLQHAVLPIQTVHKHTFSRGHVQILEILSAVT